MGAGDKPGGEIIEACSNLCQQPEMPQPARLPASRDKNGLFCSFKLGQCLIRVLAQRAFRVFCNKLGKGLLRL